MQPSSGQTGFCKSEGPWPTERPKPTLRLPGNKAAGAAVKKPVSVGVDIVQSVRTFLGQRSTATTLTVFRDQDKDRSGMIERKVRLTVGLSISISMSLSTKLCVLAFVLVFLSSWCALLTRRSSATRSSSSA